MSEKVKNWILNNKLLVVLLAGISVVWILVLIVDLPLAKSAINKGWNIYLATSKYDSLDELAKQIEQEKKINLALVKEISVSQFKESEKTLLTPVIDLFDKTAEKHKITAVSLNSMPERQQAEYYEIPFELELQGSYHALGHYINELEESSDFHLQLSKLDITTKDEISPALVAKIQVSAFFVR